MNIIINLSRHVREFPSVPVSMFDEFSRKLLRVHVVRPCLVECRMPVVDAETVFHTDFDFFVLADVREAHVRTVPFQCLVEPLQTDGKYAHHHHFVEWPCFREVRLAFYAA